MKTKLRLLTLESRENPSADPVADLLVAPTPPAQPLELATPTPGDAPSGLTLDAGPPVVVRPRFEPGPAGDRARELDFMLQQALEDMRRVGPVDTFVGPPLPPSLIEGPPERVRRIIPIPMMLPGDYGIQPLPWDLTHPDWPARPPFVGPPLPPSLTPPVTAR